MTKVVIYTDFDGTITKKSGNQTVFIPFYQSLLCGYIEGKMQDYKSTPLRQPTEVQALFESKFGPFNELFDYKQKDAEILMTADAVTFFHVLLKQPEVSINIVTKNRKDYIQAMLRYQGFSKDEISKINIMDSTNKSNDVYESLCEIVEKPSAIYLLDDVANDLRDMEFATLRVGYSKETVIKINNPVGEFKWLTYLEKIQNKLQDLATATSSVSTSALVSTLALVSVSSSALVSSSGGQIAPTGTFEPVAHFPSPFSSGRTSDDAHDLLPSPSRA